jgi:aldose 1-epimerase
VIPASALQHHLVSSAGNRVEATIARRAAALRTLRVDGVDLVEPTATTEPAPGLAGATLAPWPNRVEGARWTLDGVEQLLVVTEPEFGHANHGLLTDTDYDVMSQDPQGIELRAVIEERPGYPFELEVTVRYTLEDSGVRVSHSVRNLSSRVVAPFAVGAHPYLRLGVEPVEDLILHIRADRALNLDAAHIPRGEFSVGGSAWDLRGGRPVKSIVPHAAYTGLSIARGAIVHRLRSGTGRTVELWADPDYAWVQVYVASGFEGDDGSRTAVAVEPMTAPPNALRTGEGLRWLEPGDRWDAAWGIRLA